MDHMRNCIKGAKNSIPLRYLLLGTEWKTELKIAEIKAVIRGRAYRSILGRQWRTMNRQGERWVRNVRILPVSPFLCFCGRPVLCTQSMKQSWGTPNWLLLFFNMGFSILSKKLFFFQKNFFSTKDYKFPQYDWYCYLSLYIFERL